MRDELAPFHVWMAPAWQEIIWRTAQRLLAVSARPVDAVRRTAGSDGVLEPRVLITRAGSMSR
jgi:hypothetical protein